MSNICIVPNFLVHAMPVQQNKTQTDTIQTRLQSSENHSVVLHMAWYGNQSHKAV